MPRGARFVFENAFYHVFNRGINKNPLFLASRDYDFFLTKLAGLKKKYDHSVYAYNLLPNHFHLSIQTRKTPISKILSSLGTSYALYFNRENKHFGPVFQNRFKSILIENDNYFLRLAQYIYLNPVRAGLVADPVDYPYSGLAETLGFKQRVIIDEDITWLIGKTKGSQDNFKKFIYDGLNEDQAELASLFEKEEATLGSNDFATRALRKYKKRYAKKHG